MCGQRYYCLMTLLILQFDVLSNTAFSVVCQGVCCVECHATIFVLHVQPEMCQLQVLSASCLALVTRRSCDYGDRPAAVLSA